MIRMVLGLGLSIGSVAFGHVGLANVEGSLIRVSSTKQAWSSSEPWKKEEPVMRRALAAVVAGQQVVTTAEMVADATTVEFESLDGSAMVGAKVVAVDYEANLALLEAEDAAGLARLGGLKAGLGLAQAKAIGSEVEVLQVADNGMVIRTGGVLQSVGMRSTLVEDAEFLTYSIKASMQSAAGSFSLPVINGDGLVGVLLSYHSKDQLCQVVSTEVLTRFMKDAKDGEYRGFAWLGVAGEATTQDAFRAWLKLPDTQGGVYVGSVKDGSSAQAMGVKVGDVILEIDGVAIDRRGYYQHPMYGRLEWKNLLAGQKAIGDEIRLKLWRDGAEIGLTGVLKGKDRASELVPSYHPGRGGNYLVKGGMVFQELSVPILKQYGRDWEHEAPMDLVKIWQAPERYRSMMERVVYLSQVLPTNASVGYDGLELAVISQVNGHKIRSMKDLQLAFESPQQGLHRIDFMERSFSIYLDPSESDAVDEELKAEGIGLSRCE